MESPGQTYGGIIFIKKEDRFLKISLSLSYYEIYYTFYFNAIKTTRLVKVSTAEKQEIDNSKVVSVSGNSSKLFYYLIQLDYLRY